MARSRLALLLAALAAAAAAALLGGALRESAAAPRAALLPAEAGAAEASLARNTAASVLSLEATVRANPRDGRSHLLLGLAYQQRARETGDPSFYGLSEVALRRALELDRSDHLALSGLGSLALARHRFRDALAYGGRALALSPTTARHHGVVGDALVELGRYREAFASFDAMARLRPNVASYARVSYARELLGRMDGALSAMRLAVEAATSTPEPAAWTRVQLGKLHWSRGELGAAARLYREALVLFPGYHYALDALAQVEAARGRFAAAIRLERRAVRAIPLPQYVGQLGDILLAARKPALARRQFALVAAMQRLLAAGGVRSDLELALFDVDHGLRLRSALVRARTARAARPSIEGDAVLAWALARNGRCAEARRWSVRALRLGTQDATKLFHRGMIERCLGREAEARSWFRRALALNPHFSLRWAPVAREVVS